MSRSQQLTAWIVRALDALESGRLDALQRRNTYAMLGHWFAELFADRQEAR